MNSSWSAPASPSRRSLADEGERHFRALERGVCQELAEQEGLVIATGGGALLNAENREALGRSGLLICLQASPQSIRRRLAGECGRPLFNGNWESLYAERLATYRLIPHQLPTDDRTPQSVAQGVVELWRASR